MEMPRPQKEHEKLKALAGAWIGEERMHPSPWDPAGGPATSTAETRMDLDGFHLITDYVQKRSGQISYRGHGVFGYNTGQKCYEMWWFDSTGMTSPAPAAGKWEGDTLMFEHKTPMGMSRYIYKLQGAAKYAFEIQNSQDGKEWTTFIDGTYTKK